MITVIHIFVVGAFITWFALTVANQFDYPWVQALKAYDFFDLLPKWTFFAPNPGTSDYHLLYRGMDVAGGLSPFKEISLLSRKHLVAAFWNPGQRRKKVLSDLVMDLHRLCWSDSVDENNIKTTLSYVAILNFLTSIPKQAHIKSVQFAILTSEGFEGSDNPKLVICSEFHNV